jgi:soluble lytic murein transglycosylase
MQLMPRTAEEVARKHGIRYRGPDDLLQPDLNVRLGTLYLSSLHRMFRGDPYLFLAAYNAGPGRVSRWRREHTDLPSPELIRLSAPAETRSYVKLVLRAWEANKGG